MEDRELVLTEAEFELLQWMAHAYFTSGNDDMTDEMWGVFRKLEMGSFKESPYIDYAELLGLPDGTPRSQ